MFFNLLSDATSSGTGTGGSGFGSWIIMGVLLLVIIAFMVFNRRTQKKKQEETMKMLDAIQPGNKVKTIGGICGVVVEVCPEDNTFIMETGSEASGKSYLKFDKQAVYQTDASVKKEEVAPVETSVEEVPVAPAEEVFEEIAAEPAAEPAEEVVEETTEA